MHKESFKLCINKHDLTEALNSEYDAWIEESKEDDLQCGSPQDELAEACYPSIEKVAQDPGLSELVFGSYLIDELFQKLIVTKKSKKPYHWLDEVSHCIIGEDSVQFVGICYKK